MYEDSLKAVELDDSNFKAFLRLGEACVELGKSNRYSDTDLIDKGIKYL